MKIGDIKLGIRLTVGFGAMIILLVAICGIGMYQLKNSEVNLDRIIMVNNMQMQQANVMLNAIDSVNLAERDLALTKNQAQLKELQAQLVEESRNYQQAELKLEKTMTNTEGLASLTKIKKNYQSVTQLKKEMSDLLLAKQGEKAADLRTNQIMPQEESLRQSIKDLVGFAEERNQVRYQEAKAANGQAVTLMIMIGMIALIFGIVSAFIITRSITKPLMKIVQEANRVASGDLGGTIDIQSKDEVGNLAKAFQTMVDNMRDLVAEVIERSAAVAGTSSQLNASAQQTAAGANETAATMTEIATSTENVTRNTEELTLAAEKLDEQAQHGNQAVSAVYQQMKNIISANQKVKQVVEDLEEKSQQINKIVQLITGIAEQTNLLALNAAIEAARAGEHGRGFAVVAEEVRKLAEGSASAAKEIKGLILEIQTETGQAVTDIVSGSKEVEKGNSLVKETGESFKVINQAVDSLTKQIEQVSEAMEQTSAGVQNVAASTEEQTASMEEVSAAAESLSKLSEELNHLVGKFKI